MQESSTVRGGGARATGRPIAGRRALVAALVLGAALVPLLVGCEDDDPAAPTVDTTPPEVVGTLPSDGARAVDPTTQVRFTFSEDLDCSTVTVLSVTLQGPDGLVAGSVDCGGSVVDFDPSRTLTSGASYTAFVTTALRDRAGNALAAPVSIGFTTR